MHILRFKYDINVIKTYEMKCIEAYKNYVERFFYND